MYATLRILYFTLFNFVESPSSKKALKSVKNYDKDYQPPAYNEARVTYLQKVEWIDKVDLEKYKEWNTTSYMLISDG